MGFPQQPDGMFDVQNVEEHGIGGAPVGPAAAI